MIRIERYSPSRQALWDEFVRRSKNGTFLFERGYMDYHQERFVDHSLIVFDGEHAIALLPANQTEATLVSHGGLTYGGLLTDERMKIPLMLDVFRALLAYSREVGLTQLRYKTIPYIYHRIPAQEDIYALYLCRAPVIERSVLTVAARDRLALQERRQRGVRKAERAGLQICLSEDLGAYWNLLEETLHERHHARPVHTFAEIAQLHERFSGNIRLYACFEQRSMVAGVLIFESAFVARAQYIAANGRGRELNALDLLFDNLLNNVFPDKAYFDFGTSHDPATHRLNVGLIDQKEGFGGRTVVQDSYRIDLEHCNSQLMEQVLT